MEEEKIIRTIRRFSKKLPHFSDGRIDYSGSDKAPVLTCFVKYKDEILLLKRSNKVGIYQNKWNTVTGYLDELKPISEKCLEEIKEELGIEKEEVLSIHIGASYTFEDSKVRKNWIIYPVLIELKRKPKIKLDWEHTEYKWIKLEELTKFDVISKLDESLRKAME